MGGVRRLARLSLLRPSYVPLTNVQLPVITENWTTQETTTYNPLLPADSPAAWGGTVANLDRVLTATGSTHTALGALLTFGTTRPDFVAGALVKVQVTYGIASTCAIEIWSRTGATWTKRRRVPVSSIARSGEVVVVSLLINFFIPGASCDALWVTLAPDIGTEQLAWTCLHLFGICNTDRTIDDCLPGTPPEDCDEPGCDINLETGLCDEDTGTPDPFVFPPTIVKIPNPTTFTKVGSGYFHACPRPTRIVMEFGDIPSGGSVTVAPVPTSNVTFAEGATQTIAAPGTMIWTVATGYAAVNGGLPALYPAALIPTTDFAFTRQLAGVEALVALGNLYDILMYFWMAEIGYQEVC